MKVNVFVTSVAVYCSFWPKGFEETDGPITNNKHTWKWSNSTSTMLGFIQVRSDRQTVHCFQHHSSSGFNHFCDFDHPRSKKPTCQRCLCPFFTPFCHVSSLLLRKSLSSGPLLSGNGIPTTLPTFKVMHDGESCYLVDVEVGHLAAQARVAVCSSKGSCHHLDPAATPVSRGTRTPLWSCNRCCSWPTFSFVFLKDWRATILLNEIHHDID